MIESSLIQALARQSQSELQIALSMGYSRIDSTQNSAVATFISKAVPTASIQWQQNWSSSLKTKACWQITSIEFENTDTGTLEESRKFSTSRLGFGATHVFEPTLKLSSEIGVTEQVFATSESLGTAKLKTKPIPYLGLFIGKKLFEVRRLTLNAELGGKLLMHASGGSVEVSSGSELSAQISVEHKLKNMTVFVSGQLIKTSQGTSQASQSNTDLKSQFGISIPLGGD